MCVGSKFYTRSFLSLFFFWQTLNVDFIAIKLSFGPQHPLFTCVHSAQMYKQTHMHGSARLSGLNRPFGATVPVLGPRRLEANLLGKTSLGVFC